MRRRTHTIRRRQRRTIPVRLMLLLLCGSLWWGLFGCAPAEPVLVISETVSSNKLSFPDEELGSPDWIELHNLSDRTVDLKGYILTDKQDSYELSNMLPGIQVPPHGYAVLYASANARTDRFVLPFGLSKSGDTLCLLDASGALLERVAIPALPKDVSYARREDGTFGYCILPTPGEENGTEISDVCPEIPEPEAPAEEAPPGDSEIDLILSEVVSNDGKDGVFGGADWIELYNPGPEPVSAEGFFLSDREDKADKAVLPPVTVPAQGYAAIPCGSGEGMIDMGIASDGESLYLYDTGLALVDSLAVPALLEGQSWARNRNGVFGYCGRPTPGAENEDGLIGIEPTCPADASEPLRISEARFRNTYSVIDSYGDHADFLELYNGGSEAVALGEYYLSDQFDEPMKWRCPDRLLQPGEYLLIFLTGHESTDSEIHAPFSVSAADDGLQLYRRTARSYQRIPWSDQVPRNTSMGLADDGAILYYKYPTPGAPNAAPVADAALLAAFPVTDLHISEVCARGEDGDWIELKNGADAACDLGGWSLSDDRDGTKRQPLSGTVDAGGFVLVTPEAFRIAATGETLFLYDPAGRVRDVFDTGDLSEGLTSGRPSDGALERVFFHAPTPGGANTSLYAVGRTPAPVLSETGLYHTGAFSVTLACSDPAATIRYTLDGSAPTSASPVYGEPIQVTGSLVLRAVAQREGYLQSRQAAATYLFEWPHTLPVVTVACDPAQFKVFTQIKNIGRYPHTDAQIAFYEPDGTLGTAFPADINPRGNQSIKYPQKSLSVHLRARLGQGSVNYPFWGPGSAADYGTLILRNGSQDYTKARLRDSFALCAVAGLGLDSARTRPVIVYVNGTYYGIMDLNEGMNQDYLVTHYGVDPARISHVSTNVTVRYGKNDDFLRVRSFARGNKFSDDAVLQAFSKWVDVDYITDYLIAQTFFCNYDIKNQSYWATDDYAIRWRPVFYDIDRCFADNSSNRNLFNGYFNKRGVVYDQASGKVANMDLYAFLRDNPGWCDRFVRRYAELLCTDFSVERLQALLDDMAGTLRPEMERHIALYRTPASLAEWEKNVASMREEIAKRHKVIQEQICSEFRLSRADWDALLAEAKRGEN